jgi:hypothetical protein
MGERAGRAKETCARVNKILEHEYAGTRYFARCDGGACFVHDRLTGTKMRVDDMRRGDLVAYLAELAASEKARRMERG